MPGPYSMALGLDIFSVLAFVLISQSSMDPFPEKMHTIYVNLYIHTALCTQFQWVHGFLETFTVSLGSMVNSFCHILMFIHLTYTCCFLLCKCGGYIDADEKWLLPQGACSLVEGGGLVHKYAP